MTVEDLIDALGEYNKHAKVSVTAHYREYDFSISFSGGDGCPAEKASTVSFYVDKLCTKDDERQLLERRSNAKLDIELRAIDLQTMADR